MTIMFNKPTRIAIDHKWPSQTRHPVAGDAVTTSQPHGDGAHQCPIPSMNPLDMRLSAISTQIGNGSYSYRKNRFIPSLMAKANRRLRVVQSKTMPINMNPILMPVKKPTIRSPIKGVLVEISHRSRIAVPAARKEVVKQFYLGDLITTNGDLKGRTQCPPSMVEFPYQSRVLKIAHRSRIAVAVARKEVSNKFYLGNSTTPFFGNFRQIPNALSMAGSLPSVCARTWQSTSFLKEEHV